MIREDLLVTYAEALRNCAPYLEIDNATIKVEIAYILDREWHSPEEACGVLSLCYEHLQSPEPHWKDLCPHFGYGDAL